VDSGAHPPLPPAAAVRIHRVAAPSGVREDPYYWLRDDTRANPEVLAHLKAETQYAESMLEPCKPLIGELYEEMVGRLKQDDSSVPVRLRGYWYATQYASGQQHPIIVRWADQPDAPHVVMFDCNEMAAAHGFFQLGSYEISSDNALAAFTEDTLGRRQYRLRIKDLASGRMLEDVLDNVEPGIAWASDNRTLLYVEKDPVTLLGRRVRSHVLGADPARDRVLYEEPDESFDLAVMRSKSERYLYIAAESTTSSEWRYARADDPALEFSVVAPRTADHEYQIEHLDERCVIRTNWQARNFRIVMAPAGAPGSRERWRDVVAAAEDVFVHDFEVFRGFLAVSERSGGLRKIRIQPWGGAARHLQADEAAYAMYLGSNPELDSTQLRYVYSSLTTPATTYDYDVGSGERTLRKREAVLGDFDPANYASELVYAPARDGERVPISIVYRRSTPRDGSAPLYLYAYGAYGIAIDPTFSSSRLALLDRGFVYAIAHVRGGQELGRRWYDSGRLLNKWNTFNDFIAATEHLTAQGYAARDRVYAAGGSAGGLLLAAVMNVAPEKYAGIVAHVPFVDVVTTMLDESIPLTTLEYDEWGNPAAPDYYAYMLTYSPYDNVRPQPYPALLATTGLWDSQVQYYEPAKWVAKLRAMKTDARPVLLHVNFAAGHGGNSGRFERLREVAREYGFIVGLARGLL
jgi:oligopeptidase B